MSASNLENMNKYISRTITKFLFKNKEDINNSEFIKDNLQEDNLNEEDITSEEEEKKEENLSSSSSSYSSYGDLDLELVYFRSTLQNHKRKNNIENDTELEMKTNKLIIQNLMPVLDEKTCEKFIYINKLLNYRIYKCFNRLSFYERKGQIYTGVYVTKDFLIKVDSDKECIQNEKFIMEYLGQGIQKTNLVLPIYAFIGQEEGDLHYSIQPYIKNSKILDDWIDSYENKMKGDNYIIYLCIQLAKSLASLHIKNIVHGDIKPCNILLDDKDNIYFIDFGLCGAHNKSDGTGGTKPYCAPETKNIGDEKDKYFWVKNKKENDVWSFGLIFMTLILFKTTYNYRNKYPEDFFDENGYINNKYFLMLHSNIRFPFMSILTEEKTRFNIFKFIDALTSNVVFS